MNDGPYIANINDLAAVSTGSGIISEWISNSWWSIGVKTTRGSSAAAKSTTKSTSTTTKASTETSTTAAEAPTGTEASTEPTTASAKAATTSKAAWSAWTSETILTNLKWASLPVVAIELLDSVSSVIWMLECYNSGALWSPIRSNVYIGTDNSTIASWIEY